MKYWFEVEDAQRWGLPADDVLALIKNRNGRTTAAGEAPGTKQSTKQVADTRPVY